MGRKSNKQLIKERKARAMTVKDLKKILSSLSDDMLIGRVGHFGEYLAMDKFDTYISNAYITPNGSWRQDCREDIKILNLQTPNLGPDPD